MKKPTGKIISSITGAIFIAGILIIINSIFSSYSMRLDLTDNRIYTLSNASKKIISELTEPITMRLYVSKNSNRMPVHLKNFATRVEDLLLEYKLAGRDTIVLKKYDPEPFSDAEDSAIMDGITGQKLSSGDTIYLGLAISCGNKTVAIPFISPNAENLLEYKLTSAITEVFRKKRPTVGIMSSLPVIGGVPTQEMIKMGIFQMMKPWLIVTELRKNYNVVAVDMKSTKIENIDLLFIIHPSGISESAQFAIDQYILNGGNVVAFLDPLSFYALTLEKGKKAKKGKTVSTLNKLLESWNIKFDTTTTVADAVFARKVKTKTQELNYLTVLDIDKQGISADDVVTSQLSSLTMVFAGSFSGTPPKYLKKEVLLKSTADSCKLNTKFANEPQLCFRYFKATKNIYDLAIRLTGKFKTAFPNGDPAKLSKEVALSEGRANSSVILVADSDMIYDEICVRIQKVYKQEIVIPVNNNLSFGHNIADSLCGDKRMIGIRCRPVIKRPFKHVKKMEAEAEKEFKEKLLDLEKKLLKTEARLKAMQMEREDKDKNKFLTLAQIREKKKFQAEQVVVRKEIKNIQKQFRKRIDALENQLKWINIALMPLIIVLMGIVVAIFRKKRNSAK